MSNMPEGQVMLCRYLKFKFLSKIYKNKICILYAIFNLERLYTLITCLCLLQFDFNWPPDFLQPNQSPQFADTTHKLFENSMKPDINSISKSAQAYEEAN